MSSIYRECYYVAILLFICGNSHGGRIKRIVGGTSVPCGTLPRAASLRNSTTGQHLCGAVIVTPDYALTAAHCVEGPADQYYLELRNFCIGDNETYPEARVTDVITNEKYDRDTRAHDISILQIRLDIDDITWLNEPLLPVSSFGLSGDCTIYGYGTVDPTSLDLPDALTAGRVETVSLDECVDKLGYVAPRPDSGMLCALGDKADACQGDSGGPLICGSLLQGISSYGQSCGVKGLPGVYTSIGAHLRWINKHITRPPTKSSS